MLPSNLPLVLPAHLYIFENVLLFMQSSVDYVSVAK